MSMRIFDPVAETVAAPESKPRHVLESLRGKRIGFVWGQHVSSAKFWPALEETVQKVYEPSEIHRLYKNSTWNPAPPSEIEELARKIDYAIVGVGG